MAHDMSGAVLYVTQFPCNICAQAIIQVGIKDVIYSSRKEHHAKTNQAVEKMFADAGVLFISYDDLEAADSGFIDALMQMKSQYY